MALDFALSMKASRGVSQGSSITQPGQAHVDGRRHVASAGTKAPERQEYGSKIETKVPRRACIEARKPAERAAEKHSPLRPKRGTVKCRSSLHRRPTAILRREADPSAVAAR